MDVVVTAWPKFLARVEYLDRCLASLKKYLTVDQQVRPCGNGPSGSSRSTASSRSGTRARPTWVGT
jgi:hypothetical protein